MKILNSPFKKFEKKILEKDNSFAQILRKAVLSMYDGDIHKFGLSTICFLDDYSEEIFKKLLEHYLIHGENDEDFLELGRKCYYMEILHINE
jgi:hypothetical protein